MKRELSEIGTIPVTTSIIESSYPELKSANKKVTWLEKQGFIIRLKRGLYVANPKHSGKTLSSELIANHLYTPSYISMSTALRYYGLIPEAVYVHQSMTVKQQTADATLLLLYMVHTIVPRYGLCVATEIIFFQRQGTEDCS